MKKRDLFITITFIFILLVPGIVYWFLYDKMDHTNYENRTLYEKPKLAFNSILTFPRDYENFYNDNLPFKNEIRIWYSSFLYNNLNTSSSERVIIGKDGWLFYNSISEGNSDSIGDYRRTTYYTNDEKTLIKQSLENVKKELNKRNIEFYVFVAPNKENVYRDYLPKMISVNQNEESSKTEKLIDYLNKNSNLDIIYPKTELINNRKTMDTYSKFDTHWNNYGSYIGTMELMKVMEPKFKIPDINIEKLSASGDLAQMIVLSKKLINEEPDIEGFYDDIEYNCENSGNLQHCNSSKPLYKKTILIVGDSFRESMAQYLAKIYKRSIFIHRDYYDKDFISIYEPDIVICESVERLAWELSNSSALIND